MEQAGWTANQAFSEMKRKFGLDFLHSEFKEFVSGYRSKNLLARADS
jgi:hypothetical protein